MSLTFAVPSRSNEVFHLSSIAGYRLPDGTVTGALIRHGGDEVALAHRDKVRILRNWSTSEVLQIIRAGFQFENHDQVLAAMKNELARLEDKRARRKEFAFGEERDLENLRLIVERLDAASPQAPTSEAPSPAVAAAAATSA